MNFAQPPEFKDKFKALSLKFRRSGAVCGSEISYKSGAEFRRAKAQFKANFKAKSARKQTPQIKSWSKNEIYFRARDLA